MNIDNKSHPGRSPAPQRLEGYISKLSFLATPPGAVLFFFFLSLIYTYPLILNFQTHNAGGDGDHMVSIWFLWWVKHAIMDLGTNPYYTDYIFLPDRTSLLMSGIPMTDAVIMIPLHYIMEPHEVHNALVFFTFTMSGAGAYLLIRELTSNSIAALFGGFVFAFCPYRVQTLTGILASTHWMPLYLYFLLRALRHKDRRTLNAFLAGVLLGFNLHGNYFTFIPIAVMTPFLITSSLVRKEIIARQAFWHSLVFIMGFAIFAIPLVVLLRQDIANERVREVPQSSGVSDYVVSPGDLIIPPKHNPVLGGIVKNAGNGRSYAGFSTIVLACLFVLYGSKRHDTTMLLWLALCALFMLLSLGMFLNLPGTPWKIPLPFLLFRKLPLLSNYRAPDRFHIATMLCLAVLAAGGIKILLSSRRRWLFYVLIPVMALEFYSYPASLNPLAVPQTYKMIGKDKEAEGVLNIPFFIRDGFGYMGHDSPVSLYYQTVHEKKIVSGYISRFNHTHMIANYLNFPFIRGLLLLEDGVSFENRYTDYDREIIGDALDLLGLDYLVVRQSAKTALSEQYAREMLPMSLIRQEGNIATYRIHRPKMQDIHIDPGTSKSIPYLMDGWVNFQHDETANFAWSEGSRSILLARLKHGEDYAMSMRLRPYIRIRNTSVSISINGRPLETIRLRQGWGDYTVHIPGSFLCDGVDWVTFDYMETALNNGLHYPKRLGLLSELYKYDDRMMPVRKEDAVSKWQWVFFNESLALYKPLFWEQDIYKFINSEITMAVDRISFIRKSKLK